MKINGNSFEESMNMSTVESANRSEASRLTDFRVGLRRPALWVDRSDESGALVTVTCL